VSLRGTCPSCDEPGWNMTLVINCPSCKISRDQVYAWAIRLFEAALRQAEGKKSGWRHARASNHYYKQGRIRLHGKGAVAPQE
jgi:hypothetical protein